MSHIGQLLSWRYFN